MEAVLLNCEECLHKAEAQLTALNSLASDVNIHDVDINRRKVALLVSTLTLRLPGVVNSAEHLLQELEAKGSDELEAAMCSTTHYQASIDATKDVLRRLAEAKAELQSAGGLQECKDEELLVEGCDGPACPLAKVTTTLMLTDVDSIVHVILTVRCCKCAHLLCTAVISINLCCIGISCTCMNEYLCLNVNGQFFLLQKCSMSHN